MFKIGFSRFWKCLKATWNSPEQPVEFIQKLATETKRPHSWYSYFCTIASHDYGGIIVGL